MIAPLLFALGVGCSRPAPAPPPPDVVVLVVDTLRPDHLGLYGYERATSPQMEALAREAVVFQRTLAHSGWTLASVASLLTGLYPSEHLAVRDPDDALRFGRLADGTSTLATLFQARGYRTAAFIDNVFLAPEFGLVEGFDHYDYDGATGADERSGSDTVALALDWLGQSDAPAFTYIHIMEPHLPYLPPAHLAQRFTGPERPPVPMPFADAATLESLMNRSWVPDDHQKEYVLAMYDEEVLAADEALGELVRGLKALHRWSDTLFVLTADHGEEFWDHGGFEHGHSLYGELLRVPLVVRGLHLQGPVAEAQAPSPPPSPSLDPTALAGQRVGAWVQHADLFQAILGVAGIQPPPAAHGIDLRRFISDSELAQQVRPVLSEDCLYGPPRVALTVGEYRFILNLENSAAAIFSLDSWGQHDSYIEDPALVERLGRPMFSTIQKMRGDVDKRGILDATATVDGDNMEKLRALGYIQ